MGRPVLMKRRIVIDRVSTVTDEMGGQTITKTQVGEFWAQVTRVGGSRGLEYEETVSERPFSIVIRSNITILEDDIVNFDGQDLIVSSVERDYDKFRYQTIIASAKYNG